MQDPDLWKRLKNHSLVGPTLLQGFSNQLSRKKDWDFSPTHEAIEEYRRFVYLTQITDKDLTPSPIIDEVWRLHLTYEDAYWHDLCDVILGNKLHRFPVSGMVKNAQFRAQFAYTKKLYYQEFGHHAPRKFWPSVHTESYLVSALLGLLVLVFCAILIPLGLDRFPDLVMVGLIIVMVGIAIATAVFWYLSGVGSRYDDDGS